MGRADTVWSSISLIRVDAVTSHTYACQFWEISFTFLAEMVRNGVGAGGTEKCERALNSPVGNFLETRRRRACRRPRAAGSASKEKSLREGTRGTDRDAPRQALGPQTLRGSPAISSGRSCQIATIVESPGSLRSPPQSRYSSPWESLLQLYGIAYYGASTPV